MELKHWCKDNRQKSVGKKSKQIGSLNHDYSCVVCGVFYSWGQGNGALFCNSCKTIFVPYIDQTIYDEKYKDKYEKYQKSEINNSLQKVRWNTVLNHKDGGKLLDYGCGAGAFLKAAPKNWDVWGTEINEHCLNYCNKSGLAVLELHRSLEKQWDVITMFDVLEHMPELSVLNDIHDALKDEGLLVIATPNLTEEVSKNFKEWKHYRPHGEHTFCFSRNSMEMIANLYNFEIVEINDNESKIRPPDGNIATYVFRKARLNP